MNELLTIVGLCSVYSTVLYYLLTLFVNPNESKEEVQKSVETALSIYVLCVLSIWLLVDILLGSFNIKVNHSLIIGLVCGGLSLILGLFMLSYREQLKKRIIYRIQVSGILLYTDSDDMKNHILSLYKKEEDNIEVTKLKSTKINRRLVKSNRNKELLNNII